MYASRSDYDRGVNTFSPDGRLLQVEYAIAAVNLGSSAVGIKVKEGVVLGVERRLQSTLIEPASIDKIFELDEHIACAVSGLVIDSRTLVDFARVEAQNHRFVYNEAIRTQALTQAVCDLSLDFGETEGNEKKRKAMTRPYGVAMLIAGVDETGPCIYQTDPSGTMIKFEAKGIGQAHEGIQSILQEQYKGEVSLLEAEKLALSSLKQVMEEKITIQNVELCVITTQDKKFTRRSDAYVENLLKNLA